jgi:hypothetical protein
MKVLIIICFKLNFQVNFDDFLDVLSAYGLRLEKKYLAAFLSRCSVSANKNGTVPYREFLHRFQDRSEKGMTHTILTDNKHRLVRLLVSYFIIQTMCADPAPSTAVWLPLFVDISHSGLVCIHKHHPPVGQQYIFPTLHPTFLLEVTVKSN